MPPAQLWQLCGCLLQNKNQRCKDSKASKGSGEGEPITLMRSAMRMCDLVGPVGQGGKKLNDLLVVNDFLPA